MELDRELETFRAQLPRLLQSDPEKYVLIKGSTVVGTFSDEQEALKAGYSQFGIEPFLVKRIQEAEEVAVYSGPLTP